MKSWKIVLVSVIALVLLAGSIYGFSAYQKYNDVLGKISTTENNEIENEGNLADYKNEGEDELDPFAVLLVGISERKALNDGGRSDTIMLGLINPEEESVQVISIPRDSYVDIPGHGPNKINAAYPLGGMDLLKETVQEWLEIDILAYVSINFQGFVELVNLANGIEVYVPRNMKYTDPEDGTRIDLNKGEQVLNGEDALDFVRFRKSDDGDHDSDYDRMKRQQEAIEALAGEFISLSSINRVFNALDILGENLKISLSRNEINFMARKFISFDFGNIKTTSMKGDGTTIDGIWYEKIPEEELKSTKKLVHNFIKDEDSNEKEDNEQ